MPCKQQPAATKGTRAVKQGMNLPPRKRLSLDKTCNGALILQQVTGDLLRDIYREATRLMTALSRLRHLALSSHLTPPFNCLNLLLMPVQGVLGELLRDIDRAAARLMTALSRLRHPALSSHLTPPFDALNLLLMPVQGVSEELLRDIDREATRRMTALVAPQASEAHGPAMLRLSMGPLFEEVSLLPNQYSPLGC